MRRVADVPGRERAAGYRWEKFRRLVFATYGDVCYLCHHGGARRVDHVESVTDHPELKYVLSNCRPVHGAPGNSCPVCRLNCNGIKGGYSVERAKRIIAGRTGKPEPPRSLELDEEPGRDW